MRTRDAFRHSTNRSLGSLLLAFACLLPGRALSATSQKDQGARAKEFLSDPNVVTCPLETTAISSLDFSGARIPFVISRLQREKKAEVRHCRITLAGRPFQVILGAQPEQDFCLFDVEKRFAPYWWGVWNLSSYHKIDDKFYEFMLLENGTRIAARPYRGPLGTIRIGKGGRDLEKVAFDGSVHQEGSIAAPIGTMEQDWPAAVAECRIPVGYYTARMIHVTYDNLRIEISNNYHTDAQGRPRGRKTVYGMQIRENEPYVLDFSNDPVVVFDQPPRNRSVFSRGTEIQFAAVLVDPKLDIMIRGLSDTSIQVEEELPDGAKYKHSKSLDPRVVITRADGEIVARGVMPFG